MILFESSILKKQNTNHITLMSQTNNLELELNDENPYDGDVVHTRNKFKAKVSKCMINIITVSDTSLPCTKRLWFQKGVYQRVFDYFISINPEYKLNSLENPLEQFLDIYYRCKPEEREHVDGLLVLSPEEQADITASINSYKTEKTYLDKYNPIQDNIIQTTGTIQSLNQQIKNLDVQIEYLNTMIQLSLQYPTRHPDENFSIGRDGLVQEKLDVSAELRSEEEKLDILRLKRSECSEEYKSVFVPYSSG